MLKSNIGGCDDVRWHRIELISEFNVAAVLRGMGANLLQTSSSWAAQTKCAPTYWQFHGCGNFSASNMCTLVCGCFHAWLISKEISILRTNYNGKLYFMPSSSYAKVPCLCADGVWLSILRFVRSTCACANILREWNYFMVCAIEN